MTRHPLGTRIDPEGHRIYTWHGRGYPEQFYSVTTILNKGIPKYLVPWAARLVAELCYVDVETHGKTALDVWAEAGRIWLEQLRDAGAKLERADETPRGLALRYLKSEPDRVRDAAGERGSRVHEEAEDFVLERAREAARLYVATDERLPDWPPDIEPKMRSFVQFLRTWRPHYLATEARGFNRSEVYAGTGDAGMELMIGGVWRTVAVDYKSGNRIYPEVSLQTAANARAEFIGAPDGVTELPLPQFDMTAVLHLTERGPFLHPLAQTVGEIDAAFETFKYAREIFRFVVFTAKSAIGEPIVPDLEDALIASLEAI